MNAQKQIPTYAELVIELNHERKRYAELEKKMAVCEKSKIKYKTAHATEKSRADILQSKLDKSGHSTAFGVSEEDEKKIIIGEVSRNAKRDIYAKDTAEIRHVILTQLQYADRFWQVVKHQSIDSITQLIQGMIDQENYDRVINGLKEISIYAKIKSE